jgi:hypothetical protein
MGPVTFEHDEVGKILPGIPGGLYSVHARLTVLSRENETGRSSK